MAFVCPIWEEETLSPLSAEIKFCLECGRLVDWQNAIKMLEKMGVQKKIIDQAKNDIDRVNKTAMSKAVAQEL